MFPMELQVRNVLDLDFQIRINLFFFMYRQIIVIEV